MAKFSRSKVRPNVTSALRTIGVGTATHEGATGYRRDPKSELFLLAVSNMVREETFYECGQQRDARFLELVHRVTGEDPAWIAGFVPYLRDTMQMRSASVVMAAEYVRAGGPNGRAVVASALQRADEPAEILAYWAQTHGRTYPQPLKRGVADAVRRLYTEKAALKYDGLSRAWRMGDVIDLVHPKPRDARQSALFKYLLDHRHNREADEYGDLPIIGYARALEQLPVEQRRDPAYLNPESLAKAGITWERLSGWLQGPMDAEAWTAVIPTMGYMALLRNLRNFEEAQVPGEVLDAVAKRLADPDEVARSRQFPIRFYSAYKASGSTRFAQALETALQHSLRNIPSLPGRTLVLVDLSASMFSPLSGRSTIQRWEVASVFGAALAQRCERAELYGYSSAGHNAHLRGATTPRWSKIKVGSSVLRSVVERFEKCPAARGGTETFQTLEETYDGHDRVVILTDEQAHPHRDDVVDRIAAPIYTFNIAGYQPAQMKQGERGRYVFGGLTDAGFLMLHLLEQCVDARWPWMQAEPAEAVTGG